MKVTDRRMFDANGELREEFRDAFATTESTTGEDPATSVAEPPVAAVPEPVAKAEEPLEDGDRERARRPPLEIPGAPPGLGPSFYDLLGTLAEPISLYLGDAMLPDGRSVENLEMARVHIDLLEVLRQKTVGNLSAQELTVLEDFLYRARVRYVQKRG